MLHLACLQLTTTCMIREVTSYSHHHPTFHLVHGHRGSTGSAWGCDGTLVLGYDRGLERTGKGRVMPCFGSSPKEHAVKPCKGQTVPNSSPDCAQPSPNKLRRPGKLHSPSGHHETDGGHHKLTLQHSLDQGSHSCLLSSKSITNLPARTTLGREQPHPNPCSSKQG